MYTSIDEMLHQVFFIKNTLILGKGNSARIEEWIKSKGVVDHGETGMSIHDLHANSALLLSQIKRRVNNLEWALLNAEYGYDLSGIIDLSKHITKQDNYIKLLECDILLEYLFVRNQTFRQLQDKLDLGLSKLNRKISHVKKIINKLHCDCINKLEDYMYSEIVK